MRFVTWFQRFRQWFAKTFGPKAAPSVNCPLTGVSACPAEECPANCPNKPKVLVPPQGGSGTAPIQARPTKASVRYAQAKGRSRQCDHGCTHDSGPKPVTVPLYDRREDDDSTVPIGTATINPDGSATIKADKGVDIFTGPVTMGSYPSRWEQAPAPNSEEPNTVPPVPIVFDAPIPRPEVVHFPEPAPMPHEPAASAPEAPAPHTPEPPPSPPPAPSYDPPSCDTGSSSGSCDAGSSGGGGDF